MTYQNTQNLTPIDIDSFIKDTFDQLALKNDQDIDIQFLQAGLANSILDRLITQILPDLSDEDAEQLAEPPQSTIAKDNLVTKIIEMINTDPRLNQRAHSLLQKYQTEIIAEIKELSQNQN